MAVVVQPRPGNQSVVRANATIIAMREEAQVDSPQFYDRNFFAPLGATMHRQVVAVPEDLIAPEPVQPVAELNTAKARQAAAATSTRPSATTPPTGTKAP